MPDTSQFAALVYLATSQIPLGRISTYGAIAQAIGRPQASRAVGQALHHNPFAPTVPCHRVVSHSGKLIGFIQGIEAQKNLLTKEGIMVDNQGKIINFNKVFYQPKICPPSYPDIIQKLQALANANKAKTLSQFFKTGAGDYGACDIFWGIPVPLQRPLAQEYYNLPLRDIKKLLAHPVHEVRFTGALILVNHYNRSDKQEQKNTLDFYLNNIHLFNSWDIIDLTAPKILGEYLVNNKNYNILSTLAKVNNLWAKRAAMVANLTLIKKGEFGPALKLAKQYLSQKEELLHKATGWMLREIGKQNQSSLLNFLDQYASQMPRIMLRYSLEKLPPELREKYLKRRYELH